MVSPHIIQYVYFVISNKNYKLIKLNLKTSWAGWKYDEVERKTNIGQNPQVKKTQNTVKTGVKCATKAGIKQGW